MPSWTDLIGQEAAVAELRRDVAHARLNHAYLFEGPAGTGRATLARAFAVAALCPAAPERDGAPCGVCPSCRLFAAGNHPDYLEVPRDVPTLRIRRFVDREGADGAAEKIEHPPVVEFLRRKPLQAARAVLVIPDAERMRPEASNAFLKTLEEPPGAALILLTASARDRMLGTIVSRCRRVRVPPLPVDAARAELEKRGAAAGPEAEAIAAMAEGALGVALAFARGEATAEDWRWVGEALADHSAAGALKFADGMIERTQAAGADAATRRREAGRLLDLAALRIRRRLREGGSPRAAERGLGILWTAGERLGANVRLELTLRAMALDLFVALRRG